MGQKGSLKDRIRSWKYRTKLQKEKQKREKQEEWDQFLKLKEKQGVYIQSTTKKYNFIQIFLHSLFGLFVGIFEAKKKESTKSPSKLLQEIIELQREIEEIKNSNELPFYYDKLKQKEVSIQHITQKKEDGKAFMDATIKECKERVEFIKEQLQKENPSKIENTSKHEFDSSSKIEMLEQNNFINTQLQESENKKISVILESKENTDSIETVSNDSPSFGEEKEQSQFAPTLDSSKKELEEEQQEVITNSKNENQQLMDSSEQDKYQKYLINANKKLTKQKEEMDKIKEKIKYAKTPTALYQLESSILWIQNQLLLMEKEYDEVSKDKAFQHLKDQYAYYQLDSKDLLKNNQAIMDLLEECQKEIDMIEKRAKQSPKEIKKAQKKEKKQEKKEQKVEFYLDIEDFEQLRNQIQADLTRQLEELKAIELIPISQHSNGFFSKTVRFISNTMFVLTPMVFFKNKLTRMLTSSILVHNRIRSMRQIVEQKAAIYETGETLFTNIRSKQDCLNTIRRHLSDSLIELEQVKQNFINKYQALYPMETESILMQLDALENQIMGKAKVIQMDQSKLLQMKQKYQKILRK